MTGTATARSRWCQGDRTPSTHELRLLFPSGISAMTWEMRRYKISHPPGIVVSFPHLPALELARQKVWCISGQISAIVTGGSRLVGRAPVGVPRHYFW